MKLTVTIIFTMLSSISWGNINFDNFYKENRYEIDSIAHCGGFLQGVSDIIDFLMQEYQEDYIDVLPESEKKEIFSFLDNLSNFTEITNDELYFQLDMKCGKNIECRYDIAQKTLEGFNKGFDNIFMLYEKDGEEFNNYAKEYLSDSDAIINFCFKEAAS